MATGARYETRQADSGKNTDLKLKL